MARNVRPTVLWSALAMAHFCLPSAALAAPNANNQFQHDWPATPNQDSENAKAQDLVDRGKAAYQARDYDKAIALYTELLKLKPADARNYYNRGLAYYKLENLDSALADFTDAVNIAPALYFAWMNRANIYSRKNRFAEAVADYDKAIALKSDDFLIWYNRGIAHARLGDTPSALRDLNEALRLQPYDGASYSARADLYFTQGDLASAQADYRRALTIKPDNKHAERKLRELESGDSSDQVPGIVVQPSSINEKTSAALAKLSIAACFDNGESEDGLKALAQTFGWHAVGDQELRKNSGPAASMVGGWTFNGATGEIAIIQARENVTPPVYVCSITSKLSHPVEFNAVRSTFEESLKTVAADAKERGDQTTLGYWVPHTPACEAQVSLVYSRSSKILTIRMLHGRVRDAAGIQQPYPSGK